MASSRERETAMATCFLISPPVGTLGVAVGDPNSIVVVCVGWELTVLPVVQSIYVSKV